MKTKIYRWVALILICLTVVLSLMACGVDESLNDGYCEQFLGYVMEDDYDAAYDLVKNTVDDGDFRAYWASIQTVVEGAETYEVLRTNWNVNYSDGLTTAASTYEVRFNNGKTVLFRVVTRDDIIGIAGVHFSDITAFLDKTEAIVPVVGVVVLVISLGAIAFCIWMLVDCLRRKMRYKVLWAILIFFGTTITVTVGQSFNLRFAMGLMLQTGTAVADPGLLSVVTKFTVPVGALLYLWLRKRFMIAPEASSDGAPDGTSHGEENQDASSEAEGYTPDEAGADTPADEDENVTHD